MSDVTEMVEEGLMCMVCLQFLTSDAGDVCDCGHPIFCEECWKKLPRRDRQNGAPYYHEASGRVLTG